MTHSANQATETAPEISKRQSSFTRQQVCRMLGLSEQQLGGWERQGWIQPPGADAPDVMKGGIKGAIKDGIKPSSGKKPSGTLRRYSFADIVTLRALLRLRKNGISSQRLRTLRSALLARLTRAGFATDGQHWSGLQMRNEGKRVSVFFQGTRMEPLSGQLLFDYAVESGGKPSQLLSMTARVRATAEVDQAARAERFFQAGLRYEDRPGTVSRAIRAYQKAIELNPRATGAFINLGTIYYNNGRMSEAEECYRSALANSPDYPLVHFNLANLFDEVGDWKQACQHYEEAIRLDPTYPDPRYNLALVYEKMGRHGKALQQWRSYLKLDSQSPWASHAKKRVDQAPLRVVPSKKSAE